MLCESCAVRTRGSTSVFFAIQFRELLSDPARRLMSVVTIIDLLPITIIDGSRGLHKVGVPVAFSLSAPDRRSVPCCFHVAELGTDHRSRLDPQ